MASNLHKHLPLWTLAWVVLAILYALSLKPPSSRAYIDFGDGNYQYISWRMTEGVRLYTDILSPQPPFHLWTGYLIERFASAFGVDSLPLYRWCTTLIRLATSACVGGIALALFRSAGTAFLASLIFLFLPEGYRWSQGYQSEHLELLFLCLGFWGCVSGMSWFRRLAGAFAVAAIWTNMSALPFAILILILSVAIQPRCWTPLIVGVGALAVLLTVCLWQAGSAYFENVWSNQVASIPSDPNVWIENIFSEGSSIVHLEGFFILLALLGLYSYLNDSPSNNGSPATHLPGVRPLVVLYGIASIGSAAYVVKGGTVDYIFTLAEPMVAVFSARTLAGGFYFRRRSIDSRSDLFATLLSSTARLLLLAGTVAILVWNPLPLIMGLRYQSSKGVDLPDTHQGRVVEYSDVEARSIQKMVEGLSAPGETIWAPPYFAALAKRPIALDLSETYLWYVRWQHSLKKGAEDPAVDRTIEGITELLAERKLPVLLLNSRTGQWGQLIVPDLTLEVPTPLGMKAIRKIREMDPRLEELQSTLEREYHPIVASPGSEEKLFLQGMNERLEIWVPKDRGQLLAPAVLTGFRKPVH
jgi:hypothetical protein